MKHNVNSLLGSFYENFYSNPQDYLPKMSAEQLITAFNDNVQDSSELIEYLQKGNIFETIGVNRSESFHSRFICDLLAGEFLDLASRENTAVHFLDAVLQRAESQDKRDEISQGLRRAILTRTLTFESVESRCELSLGKYQEEFGVGNKPTKEDSAKRLDVYIRFSLPNGSKILGRDTIELFIENKVNSKEHDGQTASYYEFCDNGGQKRPFQIFVYLAPVSAKALNDYRTLDSDQKPDSPHYIMLNYQNLLDNVIEPLIEDRFASYRHQTIISDYVNCLELPAISENSNIRDLSIMATSAHEAQMIDSFISNPLNRYVVDKIVHVVTGNALFSVGDSHWNFPAITTHEAIEIIIKQLVKNGNSVDDILRKVDNCHIINHQKGTDPFLVYSPETWGDKGFHYYLISAPFKYGDRAYGDISYALEAAVLDLVNEGLISADEVTGLFAGVYSTKRGCSGCFSSKYSTDARMTTIGNLYIRANIEDTRLDAINKVLGQYGKAISIADNDMMQELYHCETSLCDFVENPMIDISTNQLMNSVSRDEYTRIGNTDFYYRNDFDESRLEYLNQLHPVKQLNQTDDNLLLLKDIFKGRRNLILSVYKYLSDSETSPVKSKELSKNFKTLMSI